MLSRLAFKGSQITEAALASFLQQLPQLQLLALNYCNIIQDGDNNIGKHLPPAHQQAQAPSSQHKRLGLSHATLRNEFFNDVLFAASSGWTKLRAHGTYGIEHIHATTGSQLVVIKVQAIPTLKSVKLEGCASLKHLAISSCFNLRDVDINPQGQDGGAGGSAGDASSVTLSAVSLENLPKLANQRALIATLRARLPRARITVSGKLLPMSMDTPQMKIYSHMDETGCRTTLATSMPSWMSKRN